MCGCGELYGVRYCLVGVLWDVEFGVDFVFVVGVVGGNVGVGFSD